MGKGTMAVMKTVEQVSGEGLESLLGEQIILFCMNYFYAGKLIGVNCEDVKLENPKIVYETGKFTDSDWKFAEPFAKIGYVRTSAIEAYALSEK